MQTKDTRRAFHFIYSTVSFPYYEIVDSGPGALIIIKFISVLSSPKFQPSFSSVHGPKELKKGAFII